MKGISISVPTTKGRAFGAAYIKNGSKLRFLAPKKCLHVQLHQITALILWQEQGTEQLNKNGMG